MLGILSIFVAPIANSQGAGYAIAKGDQLLITVLGYNEFTTTATVRDNGAVTMPLLGDIQAAGLTSEDFVEVLRQRLAEYVQGEVKITVSVLSSIGQRVTILGAVTRPENYPIASEISLLEVVSMAGGYLPDANLSRVKIFRKDKSVPALEVDLEYYIESAAIDNMPKVYPGDVVFLPRQQNVVRELGEFLRDAAFFFTLFRLGESVR